MSELKTNLEQILQEKTTKLIPENIKRKVEIFDVTGTDGDAEVEELQAKITETRREIADTRRDLENSAATVTGTEENVTLNQTADATFKKLGVGGNTKQIQYTGKNLAKVSGSASVNLLGSISVSKDNNDIIINGTATGDTAAQKAFVLDGDIHGNYAAYITPSNTMSLTAGTYVLTVNNITGSYSGVGAFWIRFVKKNESQPHTAIASLTLPSTSVSFNIEVDGEYFISPNFSYTSKTNVTFNNYKFNIMLASGTDTTYEPYVGGQASPNPNYPQEIKNVEAVNLLDESLFTSNSSYGLTWEYDSSVKKIKLYGKANNSYSDSKTIPLSLPAGTYTFTVFTDSILTSYNLWLYNSNNELIGNTKTSNPVTISEAATSARIFVEGTVPDTTYNEVINVQLEKGLANHAYTPFRCTTVLVHNKNLFDFNLVAPKSYYEITSAKKMKYKKYDSAFSQIYTVNEGEQYTFSWANHYSSSFRLYCFIADENFYYVTDYFWGNSIAANNTGSKSVTLPKNSKYLLFSVLDLPGNINPTDYIEIQIERGLTKTSYVEGETQVFYFPLAQNQKLMLGDYLADDGIHHVRGQGVLDGTETWFLSGYSDDTYLCAYSGKFEGYIKYDNCSLLCNTFVKGFYTDVNTKECIENSGYTVNLKILKSRLNEGTINGLKTWLAERYSNNIPLIVEYPLAQERIVPYTSAQQEVYDAMKRAISYEGQTNISSSNTVSPIFTVTAFKDADLVITSLDNQLTLKE